MEDFYKFDCGCKWPILKNSENGKMPKLKIDLQNLPDCDLAWKIFANGDTKGIFQLESHLGKQWSKKTKTQKYGASFCSWSTFKARLPSSIRRRRRFNDGALLQKSKWF